MLRTEVICFGQLVQRLSRRKVELPTAPASKLVTLSTTSGNRASLDHRRATGSWRMAQNGRLRQRRSERQRVCALLMTRSRSPLARAPRGWTSTPLLRADRMRWELGLRWGRYSFHLPPRPRRVSSGTPLIRSRSTSRASVRGDTLNSRAKSSNGTRRPRAACSRSMSVCCRSTRRSARCPSRESAASRTRRSTKSIL